MALIWVPLQAEELEECLDYVLHREAGSSDRVFENNGGLPRDCGEDARPLPERLMVDAVTGETRGMRFDDFVAHPSAALAGTAQTPVL